MIEELIAYIKNQLINNEFASGAAIATLFGSLLYYLRTIPRYLWDRIERKLVYKVNIYETSDLYFAIEHHLSNRHSKKYRNVEALLEKEVTRSNGNNQEIADSSSEYQPPKNKLTLLHFEDNFLLWKNKKPIFLFKGREKLENASSIRSAYLSHFTFSTFFGKTLLNNYLSEIIKEYDDHQVNSIETKVFINSYSRWDITRKFSKDLNNVILPSGLTDDIVNDLQSYKSKQKLYASLDIPYKRGYLFYGPPGNGKTSLATSIAGHLKRNICFLMLSSVDGDKELSALFNSIPNNSVLVLEDIDAAFTKRLKNKDIKSEITFSGLLNCLDGIFFKEDLLLIMTTNHIENLDPALIRPGRVDRKFYIGPPEKDQIHRYLERFYKSDISLNGQTFKCSMAEVVESCVTNSDSPEKCIETLTNHERI